MNSNVPSGGAALGVDRTQRPPIKQLSPHSERTLRGEETIAWGIIGASHITTTHMIDAIRTQTPIPVAGSRYQMTNATIVGIYSHDETHARRVADTHRIPHTFVNLMDLIQNREIQCVYVGGHPRHHTQMALAALSAGKHVLCESPIALTIDDALSMTHTALNHGLTLSINYQARANAAVDGLRTQLLDGAIGDPLGGYVGNTSLLTPREQSWRLQNPGGGVVLDRMLHTIDLVRYLFRDEVSSVYATSTHRIFGTEVEEDVISHLTLKRSGLLLQLHDSYSLPHLGTSVQIYGTTGVLIARNCLSPQAASELLLLRNNHEIPLQINSLLDPFVESVRRFQAALRQKDSVLASGNDGVFSLIAGLAALESIRLGHTVTIDALPIRPVGRHGSS